MPSNHLICCHPLFLPPVFPSITVFSNVLALCIRWPKYWSFGFSISPSNEYSGLIFFRIHWFEVFAVQGTLKSLLQHHNWKASILQCSAFFMVRLSHLYMTTGKTTALNRRIFVSKVMSLLYNTLSGFFRAFIPRSNCLLISWLQSPLSVQPCFFQFTMPELWIQPTADSAVVFSAIKLMVRGPLGQQGLPFLSVHSEPGPVLSDLIHSATHAVVILCPPFHRGGNWGSQLSNLTKPRSQY